MKRGNLLPGEKGVSVHLAAWPESYSGLIADDERWSVGIARAGLFETRKLALLELEKARQAKLIGKALEAKVTITLEDDELARANVANSKDDIQEALNVSQLEVVVCQGRGRKDFAVRDG